MKARKNKIENTQYTLHCTLRISLSSLSLRANITPEVIQ